MDYALVERLGEIGCRDYNDTFVLQETVHLHKQLIEGLLHVLLVTSAALSSDGVQLIDEYNSRLLLPRRREKLAHAFGTHTDEHLVKFGANVVLGR
jgi:hypothetical protein